MHSIRTNNCESGIPGDGEGVEPHNHSLRWHLEDEDSGRIYIVYADNVELALAAFDKRLISGSLKASGYYCQRANAIYQAKDGPTVLLDNSNGRLT
jgi:hypothetical protein